MNPNIDIGNWIARMAMKYRITKETVKLAYNMADGDRKLAEQKLKKNLERSA